MSKRKDLDLMTDPEGEIDNNIRIGGGKRCRGYLGIEILNRPYVG